MYYQKIVGSHLYLSPADLESETVILTKWFNEDREISYGNSFYHRLLGKEKVSDLLEKWNEGPFLFSIVHKENHAFMGHITLFDQADHEQYATISRRAISSFRIRKRSDFSACELCLSNLTFNSHSLGIVWL